MMELSSLYLSGMFFGGVIGFIIGLLIGLVLTDPLNK